MNPLVLRILAGAAIIAIVWIGVSRYDAHERGIGEQIILKQNERELAALQKQADEKSAALEARAEKAEGARDAEHDANIDYRDSHPLTASELCRPASDQGRGDLQQRARADGKYETSGDAAAMVSRVPTADNRRAVDRRELLKTLGAMADEQSASLREWQSTH